jgi:hypothetical protein
MLHVKKGVIEQEVMEIALIADGTADTTEDKTYGKGESNDRLYQRTDSPNDTGTGA